MPEKFVQERTSLLLSGVQHDGASMTWSADLTDAQLRMVMQSGDNRGLDEFGVELRGAGDWTGAFALVANDRGRTEGGMPNGGNLPGLYFKTAGSVRIIHEFDEYQRRAACPKLRQNMRGRYHERIKNDEPICGARRTDVIGRRMTRLTRNDQLSITLVDHQMVGTRRFEHRVPDQGQLSLGYEPACESDGS